MTILVVGVGVTRYTVQGVKGSSDRAVLVRHGKYVAVCVVDVAYGILRGDVARHASIRVVEESSLVAARILQRFAEGQLVVGIFDRSARNGRLGDEPAHIVVGVIRHTAPRSRKARYVAEEVVGRGADVACRIANRNGLTALVIGVLGAMVHRVGHTLDLAHRVIRIGRCLTHRVGYGEGLIQAVINRFADDVALRIGGLNNVSVSVVGRGKFVTACVGDRRSSAEGVVAQS